MKNHHRILPLAFTLSFLALLPLLAVEPAQHRQPLAKTQIAKLVATADREASASRAAWQAKNAGYLALVGLDPR